MPRTTTSLKLQQRRRPPRSPQHQPAGPNLSSAITDQIPLVRAWFWRAAQRLLVGHAHVGAASGAAGVDKQSTKPPSLLGGLMVPAMVFPNGKTESAQEVVISTKIICVASMPWARRGSSTAFFPAVTAPLLRRRATSAPGFSITPGRMAHVHGKRCHHALLCCLSTRQFPGRFLRPVGRAHPSSRGAKLSIISMTKSTDPPRRHRQSRTLAQADVFPGRISPTIVRPCSFLDDRFLQFMDGPTQAKRKSSIHVGRPSHPSAWLPIIDDLHSFRRLTPLGPVYSGFDVA